MSYASPPPTGYITSILDTDLYKLTMQRAVLETFPEVNVRYRFTNRGSQRFTRKVFERVKKAIDHLSTIRLTSSERQWLSKRCPFFPESYLDYLSEFQFHPREQLHIEFVQEGIDEVTGEELGNFDIEVQGKWCETILYEVPVMSIISEAYFTEYDKKWDYVGQFENAKLKGQQLFTSGCIVSEFGSRRRRTGLTHDLVVRGLIEADRQYGSGSDAGGSKGKLAGTSNVYLAMKYDLMPIGTIAHEWIMGIAAFNGYEHCNGRAMDLWEKVYPDGSLSIALTDTFTTKPFFEDFVSDPERAKRWKGLRQDSGDPITFLNAAKSVFDKVGVDPKKKVIVYSDGLDVERCLELKRKSDEVGVGCSFGVGTNLTNDFKRAEEPMVQEEPGSGSIRDENLEKSPALNMVIKLYKINGDYCVKISDEINKNTGNPDAVKRVKEQFGLEDHAK